MNRQFRDIHRQELRDVTGETLDGDLTAQGLQYAASRHPFGLADEVQRHGRLNGLGHIDRVEVDVQHLIGHRMVLDLFQEGQLFVQLWQR